jgi:hypothetical protein
MRKYCYLAMAAGAALVLSVPAGAALAANPHTTAKPVLTIVKVGGPAVKSGNVLKASLPKKGTVTFSTKVGNLTCSSSSITAKVLKNPSKVGQATLSVTSVSISKCAPIAGFSLTVTSVNLPYGATIKNSKGFPVTLSAASKAKPIGFKATVKSLGLTCTFTTSSMTGSASNKTNSVTFSKQKLTLAKGSSADCSEVGTTVTVTATYGPIVDSSVKHSPKVFVS